MTVFKKFVIYIINYFMDDMFHKDYQLSDCNILGNEQCYEIATKETTLHYGMQKLIIFDVTD